MKMLLNKVRQNFYRIDAGLLVLMYNLHSRLISVFKYSIFIADFPIWGFLMIVFFISGIMTGSSLLFNTGLLLFVSFLISIASFVFPKVFIHRKRPYADKRIKQLFNIEIKNRDKYFGRKENESFPSGHVFWSTVGLFVLSIQFGILIFIPCFLIVALMIFYRSNLGVHYPSDTIAGFISGIMTADVALFLVSQNSVICSKVFTLALSYSLYFVIVLTLALLIMIWAWLRRIKN